MRSILLLLCLALPFSAFSNAAQPGIWSAGGAGTFFLYYPEDSTAFQQVQMVQELVKIQLYPGFAVVKGVYQMHNPTAETISMRVGYPVNASYDASDNGWLREIRFDDLYSLRVRVRGKPVEFERVTDMDDWYVWETTFLPGDITTLEVDFIVPTNGARVLEGYSSRDVNAFIYLVESGATWKQPIGKGTIMVQLMDGLTLDDVRGVGPPEYFLANDSLRLMVWSFEDLSPTGDDNPVITYGKPVEDFDFSAVIAKSDEYYRAIDQLNHREAMNLSLEPRDFGNPFDAGVTPGAVAVSTVFFLAVYGIPILLILIAIVVGVVVYRRWQKRKM
jgi:hypothetical protein